MKIEPGKVVSLRYDLATEDGEIIESSDISGIVSFIHGQGSIIPGLDARLQGMEAGQEGNFEFPPEEAFGGLEDGPTQVISKAEFPSDGLAPGAKFEAKLPTGQPIILNVIEIADDEVTVRFCHPLAGQKITMSVGIEAVREATTAERESGRVQSAPPPPPSARN